MEKSSKKKKIPQEDDLHKKISNNKWRFKECKNATPTITMQ